MRKYRYLGLIFPLKHNPGWIGQSPTWKIGPIGFVFLAIREGVNGGKE